MEEGRERERKSLKKLFHLKAQKSGDWGFVTS